MKLKEVKKILKNFLGSILTGDLSARKRNLELPSALSLSKPFGTGFQRSVQCLFFHMDALLNSDSKSQSTVFSV